MMLKELFWSMILLLVLGGGFAAEAKSALEQDREWPHTPLMSYTPLPTPSGEPLLVASVDTKEAMVAEVQSVVAFPFDELVALLSRPANWCEFLPLTFNVKACTHWEGDGQPMLTVYAGRKLFQGLDKAFAFDYRFKVIASDADHFMVEMTAGKGPLGTRDYRMQLEAWPEGAESRLRVISSYRPSLRSRIATQCYLSTFGRSKVGFSVQEGDGDDQPDYVQGMEGLVERNAMRCFLALQAFLLNVAADGEERFEASLKTWFDLTELYARQLHEMDFAEYRSTKQVEWRAQQQMQAVLDQGASVTAARDELSPPYCTN